MYAIIYWIGDDKVFAYVNEDRTIKLFEELKDADFFAERWEEEQNRFKTIKIEARVISIEGVKE